MEGIEDEAKLQMLMEDIEDYMDETGGDDLTNSETEDIDESLAAIEKREFISWEDLQKTMKKWRER